MNLRRLRRGRGLAGLAVVMALLIAAVAAGLAVAGGTPGFSVRNLRIAVTDGPAGNQHVVLDASFFTPAGAGRVPAIMLAHGFGETKNAVRPEAVQLVQAGFAVLTWSARGFGKSTGQVALDSPDYEVRDAEQLVSWLARQPRVLLDHPGDPRVGIAGASYGGGIALLAAAYDHRIDAIVPQVTWNNLATALFPNAAGGGPAGGVLKKQWAGLLFAQGAVGFSSGTGGPAGAGTAGGGSAGAGTAGGGTAAGSQPAAGSSAASVPGAGGPSAGGAAARAAECGRFLSQVCAVYQQVATLGGPTPQAVRLLLRSSPASVAGRIDVPTLLIQGETDSLFGLDQADANYQAIRRNGAPVDMVWFAGGHDGGNQETSRISELTLQWFERWLMPPQRPLRPSPAGPRQPGGGPPGTGQPAFAVTRSLGTDPASGDQVLAVATAPSYPELRGTRRSLVRLSGPAQTVVRPAGGSPASISAFPGLGALGAAGLTFDMPGQSASFTSAPLSSPLQLTGSPVARVRIRGAGQVTLFAKLYDVDQAGNATLPFQLAAPLRVSGAAAARPVSVRLPAVDYQFAAGHRLRLTLTTTDFGYATPPSPAAYQVSLAGPGVSVPVAPALVVATGGLPWWTWGAPAAALLAAALILAAGAAVGPAPACRSRMTPRW